MNINKDIDVFDFTETIQSTLSYLEGAIPKITSKYDIALYKVEPIAKNLEEENFEIFNVDVENELEEFDGEENVAYNLICLNYKENLPILYYTNAAFFDNTNKTLPIGMNLSTKVLIDNKRLEFLLVNKTKFRTNSYFKNSEENGRIKSKDIFVYEYDVSLKEDKKDDLTQEKNENILSEITEKNTESEVEIAENNEKELIEKEEIYEDLVHEEQNDDDDTIEDIQNLEAELESFDEKYEDYYEEIEKHVQKNQILKSDEEETPIVKKSKKILKIEQKYEKEMQKQQEKEEKARRKLEKKSKSKKEGKK